MVAPLGSDEIAEWRRKNYNATHLALEMRFPVYRYLPLTTREPVNTDAPTPTSAAAREHPLREVLVGAARTARFAPCGHFEERAALFHSVAAVTCPRCEPCKGDRASKAKR